MFYGICFTIVYMYVLHSIGGIVCMGICVEHLSVAYCIMFNLCVSIGQQGCRDWTDSFGHPSLPVLTPHTQDDSLETPCTQPRAWWLSNSDVYMTRGLREARGNSV